MNGRPRPFWMRGRIRHLLSHHQWPEKTEIRFEQKNFQKCLKQVHEQLHVHRQYFQLSHCIVSCQSNQVQSLFLMFDRRFMVVIWALSTRTWKLFLIGGAFKHQRKTAANLYPALGQSRSHWRPEGQSTFSEDVPIRIGLILPAWTLIYFIRVRGKSSAPFSRTFLHFLIFSCFQNNANRLFFIMFLSIS